MRTSHGDLVRSTAARSFSSQVNCSGIISSPYSLMAKYISELIIEK